MLFTRLAVANGQPQLGMRGFFFPSIFGPQIEEDHCSTGRLCSDSAVRYSLILVSN